MLQLALVLLLAGVVLVLVGGVSLAREAQWQLSEEVVVACLYVTVAGSQAIGLAVIFGLIGVLEVLP